MLSAETAENRWLCCDTKEDKEFMDGSKNGIIYLDGQLNIKNLNKEAERICGIERSQVIGSNASAVLGHLGESFLHSLAVHEYDQGFSSAFELRIREQSVYVHVDTLKLEDESGSLNGLIIIVQDLSTIKTAIRQIQTTQILMSLGELAAGVAHHIRTPLTTISGYLQMMISRIGEESSWVRRNVLETMLDEVSHINHVVKQLVLFAKPPISKEPFTQINRVVEEALRLTFKELGGEKIEITKNLATNLPAISADANHLQQAIVNIMENALEAMPDGGELTVRSWLNSDFSMIVISISDTGSGAGSEVLIRAFEPFYTTKLDKMGLGLSVAQRIVAEHGGFIHLNPGEESGTRVTLYIPISDIRKHRLEAMFQQTLNLQ